MRRIVTVVVVAATALTVLAPVAADASTRKVPPVCVHRTVGHLNIQLGYCP